MITIGRYLYACEIHGIWKPKKSTVRSLSFVGSLPLSTSLVVSTSLGETVEQLERIHKSETNH